MAFKSHKHRSKHTGRHSSHGVEGIGAEFSGRDSDFFIPTGLRADGAQREDPADDAHWADAADATDAAGAAGTPAGGAHSPQGLPSAGAPDAMRSSRALQTDANGFNEDAIAFGAAAAEDLSVLDAAMNAEEAARAAQAAQSDMVRVRKKKRRTHSKKKQVRRKTLLIVLGTLLGVLLLVALACGIYMAVVQGRMRLANDEADRLRNALTATDSKDEPFYVLLLGTDKANYTDGTSRSDAMVLARVDPVDAVVTLVSIPRDTMVELPEHGRSKINAAYAYGGAAGAVEAVNRFAGVSISHYVQVDFDGLVEAVNKVGGVWVDVPNSNQETGASNSGQVFSPGLQWMDGQTALAFSRERYGYHQGDFQRSENQRLVISALIKAVLASSPAELPGIVNTLADCVSTDYSLAEVADLALRMQKAPNGITLYSAQVPSSTLWLDDVSYVTTDHAAWSEMMRLVDAGYDPAQATVAIEAEEEDAADE